ncbi:helix-turn-helix domain-containing protein [Pseudidiomarina sp. WS423]|uniref:helix-turn-helix domain-containing protein n=1 Tax=Pseudidiomarina sp. WS423 TaxID=3425124 RepID=UPI003D6EF9A5
MNHYEKGRHVPDYSLACKIASELQVPVAYFYCENDSDAERLLKIAKLEPPELKILDDLLARHTNSDVDIA